MNFEDQDIRGLERAYSVVYNRTLKYRVKELLREYGKEKLDTICTELNPNAPAPCFWKISELAKHYGYID